MIEVRKVCSSEVERRAVDFIINNWGTLCDFPDALVPVVWVTVYRAMEVGLRTEVAGGASGMVKDVLRGAMERRQGPSLHQELEEAMLRLRLLQRVLPTIRAHQSKREKIRDSNLLIDILRWNIIDAGSMSKLSRLLARLRAQSDPAFGMPVPRAVML